MKVPQGHRPCEPICGGSMCRTRLLCAIGVSCWSAVIAGGQATAPVVLSGALRVHVKDERFEIVTSIRGLPLGVRDGLQTLFGSEALDIAEPGAAFQVTDVIADPKLPTCRLVAAGIDRSPPRLLRTRWHCHVAGGAVSLDAGLDSVRVGRYRATRAGVNRRRSQRRSVRNNQSPAQVLVVFQLLIGTWRSRVTGGRPPLMGKGVSCCRASRESDPL